MRVDCSCGAARNAHRVEVTILCKAVVVSVVLISKDLVVVSLAASAPSGTIWYSRVDDNVGIAALVIPKIVFTASKDHEVSSIID